MSENSKSLYLENCIHELGIRCYFDYTPYEPATRHYPGCYSEANIYETKLLAIFDENGIEKEILDAEICLLPDAQKQAEEEILELIDEDNQNAWVDYAEYAYECRRDAKLDLL